MNTKSGTENDEDAKVINDLEQAHEEAIQRRKAGAARRAVIEGIVSKIELIEEKIHGFGLTEEDKTILAELPMVSVRRKLIRVLATMPAIEGLEAMENRADMNLQVALARQAHDQ